MQTVSQSEKTNEEPVKWTGRAAVLCAIVIIVLTSLLDAFIRVNGRHSPGFSDFSKTLTGRVAYITAFHSLVIVTVLLSRPFSTTDFLTRIGLSRRSTFAGWCAGWVALGLAVLDL